MSKEKGRACRRNVTFFFFFFFVLNPLNCKSIIIIIIINSVNDIHSPIKQATTKIS